MFLHNLLSFKYKVENLLEVFLPKHWIKYNICLLHQNDSSSGGWIKYTFTRKISGMQSVYIACTKLSNIVRQLQYQTSSSDEFRKWIVYPTQIRNRWMDIKWFIVSCFGNTNYKYTWMTKSFNNLMNTHSDETFWNNIYIR